MKHIYAVTVAAGLAVTCAAPLSAASGDLLAEWKDFSALKSDSTLAPQAGTQKNWTFTLGGGSVNTDGSLQTGTTVAPRVDFGKTTRNIGYGGSGKLTVVVELMQTSATPLKKPLIHCGNGSSGMGVALNAFDSEKGKASIGGTWVDAYWGKSIALDDLTNPEKPVWLSLRVGSKPTAVTQLKPGTGIGWAAIDGLMGGSVNASCITFGNFVKAKDNGLNFTVRSVSVYEGADDNTDVALRKLTAARSYTWTGKDETGNDTAVFHLGSWRADTDVGDFVQNDWRIFASNQTAYQAPGAVLRFDTAATSDKGNLQAQFVPFDLFGLIVESGATGYAFVQDGDKVRTTDFGDQANHRDAGKIVLHEDFKVDRRGDTTFHGPLTVTVDDGKTFTVTKQSVIAKDTVVTLDGAGTFAPENLRIEGSLKGSGKLSVSGTLVAAADDEYTLTVIPKELDVSALGRKGLGTKLTLHLPQAAPEATVNFVGLPKNTEQTAVGNTLTLTMSAYETFAATSEAAEVAFDALKWSKEGTLGETAVADVTLTAQEATLTFGAQPTLAKLVLKSEGDITLAQVSDLSAVRELDLSGVKGTVRIPAAALQTLPKLTPGTDPAFRLRVTGTVMSEDYPDHVGPVPIDSAWLVPETLEISNILPQQIPEAFQLSSGSCMVLTGTKNGNDMFSPGDVLLKEKQAPCVDGGTLIARATRKLWLASVTGTTPGLEMKAGVADFSTVTADLQTTMAKATASNSDGVLIGYSGESLLRMSGGVLDISNTSLCSGGTQDTLELSGGLLRTRRLRYFNTHPVNSAQKDPFKNVALSGGVLELSGAAEGEGMPSGAARKATLSGSAVLRAVPQDVAQAGTGTVTVAQAFSAEGTPSLQAADGMTLKLSALSGTGTLTIGAQNGTVTTKKRVSEGAYEDLPLGVKGTVDLSGSPFTGTLKVLSGTVIPPAKCTALVIESGAAVQLNGDLRVTTVTGAGKVTGSGALIADDKSGFSGTEDGVTVAKKLPKVVDGTTAVTVTAAQEAALSKALEGVRVALEGVEQIEVRLAGGAKAGAFAAVTAANALTLFKGLKVTAEEKASAQTMALAAEPKAVVMTVDYCFGISKLQAIQAATDQLTLTATARVETAGGTGATFVPGTRVALFREGDREPLGTVSVTQADLSEVTLDATIPAAASTARFYVKALEAAPQAE